MGPSIDWVGLRRVLVRSWSGVLRLPSHRPCVASWRVSHARHDYPELVAGKLQRHRASVRRRLIARARAPKRMSRNGHEYTLRSNVRRTADPLGRKRRKCSPESTVESVIRDEQVNEFGGFAERCGTAISTREHLPRHPEDAMGTSSTGFMYRPPQQGRVH
ncbi:hypothetical protein BC834DRAFT_897779 [Gloeopeniophorella convolvens]|nr:hypothetical protein BC834DRAFT_897779 [Gloeopeniophorella convolvens]